MNSCAGLATVFLRGVMRVPCIVASLTESACMPSSSNTLQELRHVFHSRVRVLQHLSRPSAPCRQRVEAGECQCISPEAAAAADVVDRVARAAARKAGRHELGGLPCVKPVP